MITLNHKQSLVTITLNHTEPEEWREKLLKALAAAVRWYTAADAEGIATNADKHSLYELASFQEELSQHSYPCEVQAQKNWDERRKKS